MQKKWLLALMGGCSPLVGLMTVVNGQIALVLTLIVLDRAGIPVTMGFLVLLAQLVGGPGVLPTDWASFIRIL